MRKFRERPLQVYLRQDQYRALRHMAKEQNVAIADLVRRGIDRVIADNLPEHDSLLNLIGIGNSGIHDLSENHDKYIIEAIMAESQPSTRRKKQAHRTKRKTSPRRKTRQNNGGQK
jgi:hypothetical protein